MRGWEVISTHDGTTWYSRKPRKEAYSIYPGYYKLNLVEKEGDPTIICSMKELWRMGYTTWDVVQHSKYEAQYTGYLDIFHRWVRARGQVSKNEIDKFLHDLKTRSYMPKGILDKKIFYGYGGLKWSEEERIPITVPVINCLICEKTTSPWTQPFCKKCNREYARFVDRGFKKGERWSEDNFIEHKIKLLSRKILKGGIK